MTEQDILIYDELMEGCREALNCTGWNPDKAKDLIHEYTKTYYPGASERVLSLIYKGIDILAKQKSP